MFMSVLGDSESTQHGLPSEEDNRASQGKRISLVRIICSGVTGGAAVEIHEAADRNKTGRRRK